MRYEISPSILSSDLSNLKGEIERLKENNIKYIHLDVMDGLFVPNITFGLPVIESLSKYKGDMIFDTHLMIIEPERYVERFADSGSDIITFHIEATKDPKKCIDLIHKKNKLAGISIKPKTDVSDIKEYIKDIDLILVMGVEPGFSGQKYISGTDEKVSKISKMLKDNSLDDKIIEVDGGIDDTNIKKIVDAGAKLIVSGSFLFKGDIKENIKKLYE